MGRTKKTARARKGTRTDRRSERRDRSRTRRGKVVTDAKSTRGRYQSRSVFYDRAVRNPAHYTNETIESIDAIRAQLSADEWRGYLRGQIAKYNWRLTRKNETIEQDAAKLFWYAAWLAGIDPRTM